MKNLLLWLCFICISSASMAQQVNNVSWKLEGNRVAISFAINGNNEKNFDATVLYVLKKEGLTYPTRQANDNNLYGNTKMLSSGNSYTIYWDILKEKDIILNEFDNELKVVVNITPSKESLAPSNSYTPISSTSSYQAKTTAISTNETFHYVAFSFVPLPSEPWGIDFGSLPQKGLSWNIAARVNKNLIGNNDGASYSDNEHLKKQRADIALGSGFRLFKSDLWLNFGVNFRYFALAENTSSNSFSLFKKEDNWQIIESSKQWSTNLDLGLNLKMGFLLIKTGWNFPIGKKNYYDNRTLMTLGLGVAF